MACRSPGGRNDSVAFSQWSLSETLSRIRGPYFVAADNAYTQTRVVLTPFNEAQTRGRPDRDNFNFYLIRALLQLCRWAETEATGRCLLPSEANDVNSLGLNGDTSGAGRSACANGARAAVLSSELILDSRLFNKSFRQLFSSAASPGRQQTGRPAGQRPRAPARVPPPAQAPAPLEPPPPALRRSGHGHRRPGRRAAADPDGDGHAATSSRAARVRRPGQPEDDGARHSGGRSTLRDDGERALLPRLVHMFSLRLSHVFALLEPLGVEPKSPPFKWSLTRNGDCHAIAKEDGVPVPCVLGDPPRPYECVIEVGGWCPHCWSAQHAGERANRWSAAPASCSDRQVAAATSAESGTW
ncbi:hypothetical protein ON010_g17097 [Phytophthora cinnamomi]|nr:hypothetical protein ON010_g17097 [Phytophthora cinnamomi]